VRGIDGKGHACPYGVTAVVDLVAIPYKREILYTQISQEHPETTIQRKPAAESTFERNTLALYGYGFGTFGSMSNSQGDIASRSIMAFTPALSLGYRVGSFTPSLYSEYNFVSQTTPVSNVSNQNLSGQGYLAGVMLKYEFQNYSIAGNLLFLGQEQTTQSTVLSQSSIYSGPLGVSLIFGYSICSKLSLLVTGKYVNYSTWNLGSISGDTLTQFSYGIGLSYELF
jgi:hypothetical protein